MAFPNEQTGEVLVDENLAKLARIQAAMSALNGAPESGPTPQQGRENSLIASKASRLITALSVLGENMGRSEGFDFQEAEVQVKPVPLTADQETLVVENIALVDQIAGKIARSFPRHVDVDDLIAAGNLGLIDAAVSFDSSLGFAFSSHAFPRIRGAILDYARQADWAPRRLRSETRKLEESQQRLASTLGRAPTDREIAKDMELATEQVLGIRSESHGSVLISIDQELNMSDSGSHDGVLTLADTLTDTRSAEFKELQETKELFELVQAAYNLLPIRLREIVYDYYFSGETALEIAIRLGVTESRVSQLKTESVSRLRKLIDQQLKSPNSGSSTHSKHVA